MESFRSTLEEVVDADLLLHVVDASSSFDAEAQIDAVRAVLREIGADAVPELLVVNKCDIADDGVVADLLARRRDAVAVSAASGVGLSALLDRIGARLRELVPVIELLVPYERGDVVAALHREGEVLIEVHGEAGTRLRARLPHLDLARFEEFLVRRRGDDERR